MVSAIKQDLECSFQNMHKSRTQTVAINGQIIWLNLLVAARSIRRKVGSRISRKGSTLASSPASSSLRESGCSDAKPELDP